MTEEVIVTGGAGFIGANVVNYLVNKGLNVHVFDNLSTGNIKNLPLDKIKFYNIDFMNLDIEGHELKVLETLDFNKINIKYLCIEMIEHNEVSVLNNEKIKDLLSQNNFKLIKNFDFNYIYKKENQ